MAQLAQDAEVSGYSTPIKRGVVFDAMYAFGVGALTGSKERLVESFRKSKAGSELEGIAVKQKTREMMPLVIAGAIVIFLAGFLLRK